MPPAACPALLPARQLGESPSPAVRKEGVRQCHGSCPKAQLNGLLS